MCKYAEVSECRLFPLKSKAEPLCTGSSGIRCPLPVFGKAWPLTMNILGLDEACRTGWILWKIEGWLKRRVCLLLWETPPPVLKPYLLLLHTLGPIFNASQISRIIFFPHMCMNIEIRKPKERQKVFFLPGWSLFCVFFILVLLEVQLY